MHGDRQTTNVCNQPGCKLRLASHLFRLGQPWIKAVLDTLVGLMLTTTVPALGQTAFSLQLDQGKCNFCTTSPIMVNPDGNAGIQPGSLSSLMLDLAGNDLNSIQHGRTHFDGFIADISCQLLSNNFPDAYNLSSADTLVVPSSTQPVPEPGVGLLCFTGGMLLLVISNKRHRL